MANINTHLPPRIAEFCDQFPPSARLCRFVNRRSGTLLDVRPSLSVSSESIPQVVGNPESAGVQYWLITPYGSGQAIIPVPKTGEMIVCYLTPSTTNQEIPVTVSPFPTSWIILPTQEFSNENPRVAYSVPEGMYEEWTALISWPHFTRGEARMLDLWAGEAKPNQRVVIYPFEQKKQWQCWTIQFVRYKPMESILPILPTNLPLSISPTYPTTSGPTTHSPKTDSGDPCDCDSSRYGVKRSPPDVRDFVFKPAVISKPVDIVNLRNKCPPIWYQGNTMSCVAQAVAAAFEFDVLRQNLTDFFPSRLFIWYHARAMSTDKKAVYKNCGCTVRDAIKSLDPELLGHGVCGEEDWPFEEDPFNPTTHVFDRGVRATSKPDPIAYAHALKHTGVAYFSIQNTPTTKTSTFLDNLANCLMQGHPFVFIMNTYDVLQDLTTGVLKMPDSSALKQPKDAHAVMAVGFDRVHKYFIIRNSWGIHWGDQGYFTMPYAYVSDPKHCFDFWTIRVVNSSSVTVKLVPAKYFSNSFHAYRASQFPTVKDG